MVRNQRIPVARTEGIVNALVKGSVHRSHEEFEFEFSSRSGWLKAYLKLGWPVFPLHSIESGHCTCWRGPQCRSAGKHPRNRNGFHGATAEVGVIRDWWHKWPRANIGIATGVQANLVVVDVDPRHGGDCTLSDLRDRHGKLPRTYAVRTGGGGLHFYFDPSGVTPAIRNSSGRLGQGIDVRGVGGYVVAPPSETPSGLYSVEMLAPLAVIPDWIVDVLQIENRTRASGQRGSYRRGISIDNPPRDVDEAVLKMLQTPEGNRNQVLNFLSFWAGKRIGQGLLDSAEVKNRLVSAAKLAGLDDEEIEKTMQSGLSAGIRLCAR